MAFVADRRRQIREHNRDMTLAYNIAGFQRTKRLPPKVDKYLLKEPKRKQSWQEQFAIAQAWVADAAKQKQREKVNGR